MDKMTEIEKLKAEINRLTVEVYALDHPESKWVARIQQLEGYLGLGDDDQTDLRTWVTEQGHALANVNDRLIKLEDIGMASSEAITGALGRPQRRDQYAPMSRDVDELTEFDDVLNNLRALFEDQVTITNSLRTRLNQEQIHAKAVTEERDALKQVDVHPGHLRLKLMVIVQQHTQHAIGCPAVDTIIAQLKELLDE